MPRARVNGADLYYEERGQGSETIVFGHGLALNGRMFESQMATLEGRFRCVAFDFRGQGRSEVTPAGYDMDTLCEDVAALIGALGCGPCHYLGHSMGGFVGIRLAARHPALVKSLVLSCSSADPASGAWRYRLLCFIARWFGMRPVVAPVMKLLFDKRFLADPSRSAVCERWRGEALGSNVTGLIRATQGVSDQPGCLEELGKVGVPVLILAGEQDKALPPVHSERLHARLPGSRLVIIPSAGHTPPIEEPEQVNGALREFWPA